MAIDYLKDIKPLEEAGLTDAQIAAFLSYKTERDILTSDARVLMRERGLWLKDPIDRQMRHGTIGVGMASGSLPQALYDALVELNSALYDLSADYLFTSSDPTKAGEYNAIISSMQSAGLITADDATAFYEMGGGQPFAGTVEADVTAARDAHLAAEQAKADAKAAQEAEDALASQVTEKYNQLWNKVYGITTWQGRLDAVNALDAHFDTL